MKKNPDASSNVVWFTKIAGTVSLFSFVFFISLFLAFSAQAFTVGDLVQVSTGPAPVFDIPNGTQTGTQDMGASGSLTTPQVVAGISWWNVLFDAGVSGWMQESFLAPLFSQSLPTVPSHPLNLVGLRGEYFNDTNLTNLAITRIDPAIDFSWSNSASDPTLPSPDNLSVRWMGEFVPSFSETYTLYTTSDGGVRVWVNGTKIIDDWAEHDSTVDTGVVTLVAGQQYYLQVEYRNSVGLAAIRLEWSSASQSREIIPQSTLVFFQPPTLSVAVSPTPIRLGDSATLAWVATNADTCTSSNITTGSATVGTISVAPSSTTVYSITCSGAGGSVTASSTLTVVPLPTASLSATPSTVIAGQSSTLSWNSADATSCTGDNFDTGSAVSGSVTVNPTATSTYTLSCVNMSGTAVSVATVNVIIPPTITLTASPTSIIEGESSTITWSSTNADICTGTGFSTGSNISGSVTVSPTATTTYGISCTGAGGTMTSEGTVNVTLLPPVMASCSVSPTSVFVGNPVTWTAAASGGNGTYAYAWSGTDGITGSTNPLTVMYAASGTKSAQVVVTSGTKSATATCTNTVLVTVPDKTPPSVTITLPANGATLSGTTTVSANASDNVDVVGVQFILDGINLKAEENVLPYSIGWNTLTTPDGLHTLTAVARDAAGNRATSSPVTVTVKNTPTVTFTASPTSITEGDSSTLAWSSTNAVSCTGTGFSTGSNISGSVTVSPTATTTYGISCTGAGGTVTGSATVNVTARRDTTPPSTPGNLVPTVISSSQVNLTWNPSIDLESGVVYYEVRRCIGATCVPSATGVLVGSSTTPSFSNIGLTPGTTYRYQVRARNGVGLFSAYNTNPKMAMTSGATTKGLKAQYFSGTSFTKLALTRTDATVNFDWDTNKPSPSLPSVDNFSVLWTGTITPLYSQKYTFYTTSDDGVRLWVNGQKIIDDWVHHPTRLDTGTITLSAGQKYDIKIEYYEGSGKAIVKLEWSSASQSRQVVPQSQLSY